MLADGIQKLKDIFDESKTVSTFDPGKCGIHANDFYYIQNGELKSEALPIPNRKHYASTVESFVAIVERFATENTSVWVGFTDVRAVLDDGSDSHRSDKIYLELKPSPIWKTLATLNEIRLKQKRLLDIVRRELKSADVNPANVDLSFEKVKWLTTDEETSEVVKNTSDQMGRDIRSKVEGTDKLPEQLTIGFNAYPSLSSEFNFNVFVDCSVDTDTSERVFLIRPYPGAIDEAKSNAVEQVRAHIKTATGIDAVFCGTP